MARIQRMDQNDESRDGTDGEWMLSVRIIELTAAQRDQLAEWLETLVPHLTGMS